MGLYHAKSCDLMIELLKHTPPQKDAVELSTVLNLPFCTPSPSNMKVGGSLAQFYKRGFVPGPKVLNAGSSI